MNLQSYLSFQIKMMQIKNNIWNTAKSEEARNMDTSHSNCIEANLLETSKWDPEFGEISKSLDLESIDQEICKLLDLPDDVLLIIVRRLNHFDLLSLSETCKRLNQLCLKTQSLWIDVDFSVWTSPVDKADARNHREFPWQNKKLGVGGFSFSQNSIVPDTLQYNRTIDGRNSKLLQ